MQTAPRDCTGNLSDAGCCAVSDQASVRGVQGCHRRREDMRTEMLLAEEFRTTVTEAFTSGGATADLLPIAQVSTVSADR